MKTPLIIAMAVALITFGVAIMPIINRDLGDRVTGSVSTDSSTADAAINQRVARARFYDQTVIPLITEVDAENNAAAVRCLARIDLVLQGYHAGVDSFADDMTSLSTRLGVLKRMPAGWWNRDGRVEAYVQSKFEQHLFSQQKLVDDLSGALLQFRNEVDANQVLMLTRIQAALSTADLPGVELEPPSEFLRNVSSQFGGYASQQGTPSVENLLGALVLGEVGSMAARSLVAGLLVRFVPSVAISSAAGASATVGASATGAGGGSLGGPVGTVVGFGVGLAIGLVVDWWMTERFEAELRSQMHAYLDDLEATLISGQSVSGSAPSIELEHENMTPKLGLQDALPRLCEQLHDAYRDRFYLQIVDGESS